MEYTKDIVLEIGSKKTKIRTSRIKGEMRDNKIIIATLALLSMLMTIDVVLVNTFLQLFSKVY